MFHIHAIAGPTAAEIAETLARKARNIVANWLPWVVRVLFVMAFSLQYLRTSFAIAES
jgi:hypothetical protein